MELHVCACVWERGGSTGAVSGEGCRRWLRWRSRKWRERSQRRKGLEKQGGEEKRGEESAECWRWCFQVMIAAEEEQVDNAVRVMHNLHDAAPPSNNETIEYGTRNLVTEEPLSVLRVLLCPLATRHCVNTKC